MKKPFFRRRSALLESRLFSFGSAVVAFGFAMAALRTVAPSAFITLAAPALNTGTTITAAVGNVLAGFGNATELTKERDALARKDAVLTHENKTLTAQVASLAALLGTTTEPMSGVAANVLARPPESPYGTLLIDAGSINAVSVGDRVLAQGNVPVGTIVSLTAHAARVMLFSSATATTTAWVGAARVPIVLKGEGAGAFSAAVPNQTKISVGDTVLVAGSPARPVGTVARVSADAAAAMKTLYIRPLVNIFSLTTVEVVP